MLYRGNQRFLVVAFTLLIPMALAGRETHVAIGQTASTEATAEQEDTVRIRYSALV